jgi:hypothetical protein
VLKLATRSGAHGHPLALISDPSNGARSDWRLHLDSGGPRRPKSTRPSARAGTDRVVGRRVQMELHPGVFVSEASTDA